MLPALERQLATLDRRTDAFLSEIEAMTEEQQGFRPGEEAWSPVMVAHHLALYESAVAHSLERREGGRKRRRGLKQKLLYPLVNLVLRTSIKVKVPTRRGLPDETLDFAAVREMWREIRGRIQRSLEQVEAEELDEEAWRHPVAGPVDFRECLAMAVDHLDHHRRQLERIRRAPGFPAASS